MYAPHLARAVVNTVNLSTLVGLVIAACGRSRFVCGPGGIVVAENYRLGVPKASAFTVGNVVVVPGRSLGQVLELNPRLLEHEDGHTWQYCILGLVFFPLYLLANAWSWLRTGDIYTLNVFEQNAGLATGGYPANNRRRGPLDVLAILRSRG